MDKIIEKNMKTRSIKTITLGDNFESVSVGGQRFENDNLSIDDEKNIVGMVEVNA